MTASPLPPIDRTGTRQDGESDRLASHRRHCELARGRWVSVADVAADLTGLLLGHVVTALTVLTGLVVGVVWLLG